MAKKQVKTKVKKQVKKSFFEVSAPLISQKIHLYGPSPEALEGNRVKIDLTKSLRGKSLELKLKIKNNDGALVGIPESLELVVSYIRRVMRKGTDYVEDSFETECKDALVRVKPLLITRKRVSRAVLNAIRELAKKHLISHLKTRDASELFSDIMANKLQKSLSLKIKKVYPLALCEIRVFKILGPLSKEEKSKKE